MEQKMDAKQAFAKRLKEEREKQNWSQDTLATKVGVSQQSITYYEKGARVPDILTARKFAECFDVTTDYLLGLSDNRTSENDAIGKKLGLSDEVIALLTEACAAKSPDTIKRDMAENTNEDETFDFIGYFQAVSPNGFTKATANHYLLSVNRVCNDVELMEYLHDYITNGMPKEVTELLMTLGKPVENTAGFPVTNITQAQQSLWQDAPELCRAIHMYHIQKRLTELAEEYAHSTSTANLLRRTEDMLERLKVLQPVVQSLSDKETEETKGE